MTKEQRRALAILLPFNIALLCFFYFNEEVQEKSAINRQAPELKSPPEANIGLLRRPASQAPVAAKTIVSHSKSGLSHPVWKDKLESTLKTQAGNFITKIDIEKVDTFDWKVGKVDVRVDSIIVKLENVKGQHSSFRAIVDATSGKILQTWDAPVVDNFTAKSSAEIKIDSRYHND